MLDCCISLEQVKKSGMTLDEFICVAACQGLTVRATRPPSMDLTSHPGDCEAFRGDVRRAIASSGKSIVDVSYDRGSLGQAGSGHFSPIGAYHVRLYFHLL